MSAVEPAGAAGISKPRWRRTMGSPLDVWIDHRQDDARSVSELISAALGEPDGGGGRDASSALRRRGSREVFDRASELCRSPCAVERMLGADILGELGIPVRIFPKPCLKILLGMLESETDLDVLWSVLTAFNNLRDPEAIVPAARFRHHADHFIREGVVHAMMEHEDPLAVEILIGLTDDPHSRVRDWATFALGSQVEWNTPALRDALNERLADECGEVRREAVVGLARCGDRRVFQPLRIALKSERVCILEIEAAELIADPELYPDLVALREWWDFDKDLLERAILACSPRPDSIDSEPVHPRPSPPSGTAR